MMINKNFGSSWEGNFKGKVKRTTHTDTLRYPGTRLTASVLWFNLGWQPSTTWWDGGENETSKSEKTCGLIKTV